MRNLNTFAHKAMEQLDAIGIKYGRIVKFEVNTRAKKRWGQCKRTPEGYYININSVLLDERNSENGLMETIIHEILHTCNGCMNHGAEWQRLAEEVNRVYGYKVKRTNSAEEKGMDMALVTDMYKIAYKYALECTNCHHVYQYARAGKVVKNPSRYRCGYCNSQLVRTR